MSGFGRIVLLERKSAHVKGWRTPARASLCRRSGLALRVGVGQPPREETAGRLTTLSVARCYGHLIRAGGVGGDGAGAAMQVAALQFAFAGRSMSALGKADPKAERDCIVSGRAQARPRREDRRWRRDRVSI